MRELPDRLRALGVAQVAVSVPDTVTEHLGVWAVVQHIIVKVRFYDHGVGGCGVFQRRCFRFACVCHYHYGVVLYLYAVANRLGGVVRNYKILCLYLAGDYLRPVLVFQYPPAGGYVPLREKVVRKGLVQGSGGKYRLLQVLAERPQGPYVVHMVVGDEHCLETVRPKAFSSQFAFDAAQAHPRIYQDSGAYAAVFFLSQEITVAAAPAGE